MTTRSPVLVTWVAVNNDPFERERGKDSYRLVDGEPTPGPTLTLLFDDGSPFAGDVGDVVLLHRETDGAENTRELRAVEETVAALHERHPKRLPLQATGISVRADEKIRPRIAIHPEEAGRSDILVKSLVLRSEHHHAELGVNMFGVRFVEYDLTHALIGTLA